MAKIGISVRLPVQLERDIRVEAAKMDLNRSQAFIEALENWLNAPVCPACDRRASLKADGVWWCIACGLAITPVGEEQRVPQCPECNERAYVLSNGALWCGRCDCDIALVANEGE